MACERPAQGDIFEGAFRDELLQERSCQVQGLFRCVALAPDIFLTFDSGLDETRGTCRRPGADWMNSEQTAFLPGIDGRNPR
jgi:hypothetical protein